MKRVNYSIDFNRFKNLSSNGIHIFKSIVSNAAEQEDYIIESYQSDNTNIFLDKKLLKSKI